MKTRWLVAVMIVSCFLVSLSQSHAAEVIKLKYSNYFPPTYKTSVLITQFCEEIKKRTNGRVEIIHFPGGTLTTAPKMFTGVVEGVSDIGVATIAYNKGRFPLTEAQDLPIRSGWVATQVANEILVKFKPKEWDSVHVLYLYGNGPSVVMTLKKPVSTLEDFKGLKIRAIGQTAEQIKALGGTPVPMEMVDLYDALRRGVIDGADLPAETLKGWKLGELVKYVTPLKGVGNAFIFYVVMNKEKWEKLPGDIKKIFDEVCSEWKDKQALAINEIDIEGLEFFKQGGGQIISLSDAEAKRWEKAVEPVQAAYKKQLVSLGFKQAEINALLAYMKERAAFWAQQEKEKGISTPFQ